jgi:hypothetical protein
VRVRNIEQNAKEQLNKLSKARAIDFLFNVDTGSHVMSYSHVEAR